MLDAWISLPAWLRVTCGLILLLAGGGILLAGITGHLVEGHRVIPRFTFVLIGLGFAMILVGGKSDSERNGYHF